MATICPYIVAARAQAEGVRAGPHTVRGFAVVRKKLALRLESEKTDGERVIGSYQARRFPVMALPPPQAA